MNQHQENIDRIKIKCYKKLSALKESQEEWPSG